MPLSTLRPTPTLRRAVAALQLLPLVALATAGATFLLDYPTRGIMPWLEAAYGIAHHTYPVIAFVFAGVYGVGLLRFYTKHKGRTVTAALLATAGLPVSAHAVIVLYYQLRVNPGASLVGSVQWILVALFLYVIAWVAIALQEMLWEIEFNATHTIH